MTKILIEDYQKNMFRDTLLETVFYEPWSLDFKSIIWETRKGLEEAITEWLNFCKHYLMLTEADAMSDEQADAIIQQFVSRKTIPRAQLDLLHTKISPAPPAASSKFKSMAAKFLAPIEKSLAKLNTITKFPPVDDKIQKAIKWIEDKTDNDPLIKTLLRRVLAIAKKGGWVASAALIVLGAAQTFLSLPFLGTAGMAISIVAVAARIIADLASGKSLAYTIGKAATLWGIGYSARQLFDMVMPLLQQAESLPVPDIDSSQGEIPGDAPAYRPTSTASIPDTPTMPDGSASSTASIPDTPTMPDGSASSTASIPDADETLPLPPPEQYPVKQGDTLSQIAQKFKLTVQQLWDANKDTISDPDKIKPGQILSIPGGSNQGMGPWTEYKGKLGK